MYRRCRKLRSTTGYKLRSLPGSELLNPSWTRFPKTVKHPSAGQRYGARKDRAGSVEHFGAAPPPIRLIEQREEAGRDATYNPPRLSRVGPFHVLPPPLAAPGRSWEPNSRSQNGRFSSWKPREKRAGRP